MPRGADDRYWEGPGLPSVFKHTLLQKYMPQFAGMTGSRAQTKRVVVLDGFAGRGRYKDGSPASAERILKIAQDQSANSTLSWTCFFVEREDEDAAQLVKVVGQYAEQGVTARAHHGSVLDVLDDVVRAAVRCPLFLFLDPCGLGIPTSA
jgi:three-Cys-motif partner protein